MKFTAYKLYDSPFRIEPAAKTREWMDNAPFSYHCQPMVIANQMGWVILCPIDFSVTWDGDPGIPAISFEFFEANNLTNAFIMSHFGSGIVTFSIPYLFRTPQGYGLMVRGLPNYFIRGVYPLEGFVETDWNEATFTMNWKITEPGVPIRVNKGDPICMVTPYKLTDLTDFETTIEPLDANPFLRAAHQNWVQSRTEFNARTDRKPNERQKNYLNGMKLFNVKLDTFEKEV